MKILSKYILREHLTPFVGAIVITMFVMMMDFVLDILNLIISKGVPVWTVLQLFVLNFAWMLALAVPMSCLIAGLMAFGRLTEDGEITATASSGISLLRLMVAPVVATLVISLFMIYFSDRILPESNYEAKLLLGDIKRQRPTLAIKERVFIDDFPDAGLYIEEVNEKTDELYGITVFDGQNRKVPRIVKADYGIMSYNEATDALTFELHDGTIHEIDERDPSKYTRVDFDIQTIRFKDLGLQMQRRESTHRGDRELKISDMKFRIAQKDTAVQKSLDAIRDVSEKAYRAAFSPSAGDTPSDSLVIINSLKRRIKATIQSIDSQRNAIRAHQRFIRKYKVEVHKKITLPFACLFFLIAGAPVGVYTKKGGTGIAIGFGVLFFVLYWAFLIGGEGLADRGYIAPWLAMWSPNFVMLAIGGWSLYRTTWSSRFRGFSFISKTISWVSSKFRKKP